VILRKKFQVNIPPLNLAISWHAFDLPLKGAPPKVVHFKFGNLIITEFHQVIRNIWPEIELLLEGNNLINVYFDRIESIA
jgi:hypothetical protein